MSLHMIHWFSSTHFTVLKKLHRLMAKAPYLIEKASIAPHIIGSGVFLVEESFRCSPLHWDLASMRDIVVLISQVP